MQQLIMPFFAFCLGALVSSLMTGSQSNQANGFQSLFFLDGTEYTIEDMDPKFAQALYDVQSEAFDRQAEMLGTIAINIHVEGIAAKEGKTVEAVGNELFDMSLPSEEEARAFYDQNRASIGAPYGQISGQIKQHLLQQKAANARQQFLTDMVESGDFQLLVTRPLTPIVEIDTEGYFFKGPEDAPVHIVEFADYQCPHCKHAGEQLAKIYEQFDGKVRITYIDFPINSSGISRKLAIGAYCAGQQDQYWAYHDKIFERQDQLQEASVSNIATELNLNMGDFGACIAGSDAEAFVARSMSQAAALSIRATPTMFINGKRMSSHNQASLEKAVKALL